MKCPYWVLPVEERNPNTASPPREVSGTRLMKIVKVGKKTKIESPKIIAYRTKYHSLALFSDYNQALVNFLQSLQKEVGWKNLQYNRDHEAWLFSDMDIARHINKKFPKIALNTTVAPVSVSAPVASFDPNASSQRLQAWLKTNTLNIPKKLHDTMYEYQREGASFIAMNDGNVILADSPGLGKTLQTLAYLTHANTKRALIVTQSTVKPAWEDEVHKWTNMKAVIINSDTDLSSIPSDVQIWIINYDILVKHLEMLLKIHFDNAVLDEAHYIKNPKAKRTKAAIAICRNIKSNTLLTGTPILSRPVELFTLLNVLNKKEWNNWYAFTKRYCNGHKTYFGYDASGASNIDELRAKIDKIFIRRTKDQVMAQLPPRVYTPRAVDMTKENQRKYSTAEKDLGKFLKEYKGMKDREVAKTMRGERLAKINLLREIAAIGKIDAVKELAEEIINNGEKVVIFSSFNYPLQVLAEHFGSQAVMITGSVPQDDRGPLVKQFQKDPETKIFLGGIKSTGVGITLTESSNVIFLDYSWVPADHIQAGDRCHRIGSEKHEVINIYQLYTRGTIDDKMRQMLTEKTEVFEQLIGSAIDPDAFSTEQKQELDVSLFNDVLSSLEEDLDV